ncbi:MAG TPA: hypothetical protein PKH77_00470 [Anaerolineae bacterium]|nr:hypothetical protein [Anaerolineae bacterium]
MKKRLKMHWTFLVLYLVFAALTMLASMWLVAAGSGSFWLTLVVGLLLCFVIPTGFRICDLCAYYPAKL